eukprot:164004-Rhodomonas_salina.2
MSQNADGAGPERSVGGGEAGLRKGGREGGREVSNEDSLCEHPISRGTMVAYDSTARGVASA